jgi:hypothetical protein
MLALSIRFGNNQLFVDSGIILAHVAFEALPDEHGKWGSVWFLQLPRFPSLHIHPGWHVVIGFAPDLAPVVVIHGYATGAFGIKNARPTFLPSIQFLLSLLHRVLGRDCPDP